VDPAQVQSAGKVNEPDLISMVGSESEEEEVVYEEEEEEGDDLEAMEKELFPEGMDVSDNDSDIYEPPANGGDDSSSGSEDHGDENNHEEEDWD